MTDRPPVADVAEPDVALVLSCYEAYACGDIAGAVAPLHPDVEWIEPDEFPNGGRRVGPSSVAEYLQSSYDSFDELHSNPVPYRHGGNVVMVHNVRGRLRDGSEVDMAVADVFTVCDDAIVRMQAYANPDDAFAQAV